MGRAFAKYEGLGNDFVVIDASEWPEQTLTPAFARAVCDRHRGIGADGVLWIGPGDGEHTDARMVVINADGSRPEMCGNGVRCVVAHLGNSNRLAAATPLRLMTDAGLRPASLRAARDAGGTSVVDVDMGPVRVDSVGDIVVSGRACSVVPVDVGNPHAVIFGPLPSDEIAAVRAIESRRDVWPRGVNVEFVRIGGAGEPLRVRVHERGVGWTQACGTGACAVAGAAVARGLAGARIGTALTVQLDGGSLEVVIERANDELRARVQGPARHVFTGTIDRGAAIAWGAA